MGRSSRNENSRMNAFRFVVAIALAILLRTGLCDAQDSLRKGSLVIVGGGGMPDSVRAKFMELAGGKSARIVVIPTASEYADKPEEHDDYLKEWRKLGPASLMLLHTRSRETANSAEFTKSIDEATAIWFSGGDQSKLTEAYRGTAAEIAFDALLTRGGVIGGTSAGAAIMSEVMITGGRTTATLGEGFGFLPGAVVDQHFLRRSRLNRLIGVIAQKPELTGIGIDEATALVVEGEKWSVVGNSFVLVIERGEKGAPVRIESIRPGQSGKLPAAGHLFFPATADR